MNKPHFENKYLLPSVLSRNECTTLLFIEVESPPTQDLLWGREGVAQLTNAARRALRRRGRRPCARAEALASEPAGANRGPEQAAGRLSLPQLFRDLAEAFRSSVSQTGRGFV